MTEPIPPEAYLIIAASMNNAVKKYRDRKRAKQEGGASNISVDSSKPSMTLPADEVLWYAGLKVGNDGYVQWAMDNPAHPRNWSRRRKLYDFGLILFFELLMSTVSTVGTPASFDGLQILGHGREVGLAAFTTTYLAGQALAVLLLSPYAKRLGRRPLYIGSAFLYSVFCLPVAATSNIAGVVAGRLLTGIISAIPAITARPSIEDLFDTEGRMWASFSLAAATNLGLVLGPIYASYVATSLNWRWPFYLAAMIVAVTGIPMYFIRESHSSLLLERAIAAIHSHRADLTLRTAPRPPRPSILEPLTVLFTNPAIFISSLANAFSTALIYLFAVAFPLIYASPYGWSEQKTTLIFLFIALGLFLSTLTRFHDRRAIRKSRLANPHVHHHLASGSNSLFGLAVAAPTLAIALWWFAWTIPDSSIIKTITTTTAAATIAWPASAISLIPLGYAINEYSTTVFLPQRVGDDISIIDAASSSSSSTTTRTSCVTTAQLATRAIFSACVPLFTRQMFEHLGAHVAGSVLAAVATALCLFSPVVLTILVSALVGGRGANNANEGLYPRSGREIEDEKKEYVAALKNGKTDITAAAGAGVAKPKKTVRWHDEEEERAEMDSSASTITNNSEVFPSLSLSSSMETETKKEELEKSDTSGSAQDRASSSSSSKEEEIPKLDDDDDNARIKPSIELKTKDNSRNKDGGGGGSGSWSDGDGHNNGNNSSSSAINANANTKANPETKTQKKEQKKEKEKKKEKKRDSTRADNLDNVNGADVGYCYWGVDLERLAVFPFL